jgi:hypothetical protein
LTIQPQAAPPNRRAQKSHRAAERGIPDKAAPFLQKPFTSDELGRRVLKAT